MRQELDNTMEKSERVAFRSLPELHEHIRIAHPPTCRDCGKNFRCTAELAMHIESQHADMGLSERRRYPCLEPDCGRSFTQKGNLVTHMNYFHLESKAFVCGTVDLNTLTRIDNWNGSNACGRPMTTKGNLVEHIRTVHLGLEPSRKTRRKQKAADAKAAASQATSSTVNLLTGFGYEVGRDFQCKLDHCPHRFQKEYDLRRHMDNYHGLGKLDTQSPEGEMGPAFTPPSSIEPYCVAGSAEVDADTNLSQQFSNSGDFEDYFEDLEESAAMGGDFWLGAEQPASYFMESFTYTPPQEMQGIEMGKPLQGLLGKSISRDVT